MTEAKRAPFWQRAFRLALAFVLAFACLPTVAHAEPAAAQSWADDIEAMLAAAPYVEGEVIVGYYGHVDEPGFLEDGILSTEPSSADELEALIEVDSSNCDLAGQDGLQSSGALSVQATQDEIIIAVETSENLTTAEMMRKLADDPRVAFAEPNYLVAAADNLVVGRSPSLTASADGDPANASESDKAADLTPLQWANSNDTSLRTVELDGADPASSVNVPAFGATGSNMDRKVTVAVFDSLVDYTHPDLANVVREFSEDEQRELGCGQWGYNAALAGAQDEDSFLVGDHATHCAGIIGAAWDGSGTSGVASNVSIVSVQVLEPDDGDSIALSSLLRGFAFVDRYNEACSTDDEKIRVISISIGFATSTRSIDAAVRELGEKHGTATVVSAGNGKGSKDADLGFESSLGQNPYALVVASTNIAGNLSTFSDYGAYTVALGAPGTGILSTVPADYARYISDADSENIFYEGFENETPAETDFDGYKVSITQIPYDSSEGTGASAVATSGNGPRFFGEAGAIVAVDEALASPPFGVWSSSPDSQLSAYEVRVKLTGQQVDAIRAALERGEKPYLGFALSSRGDNVTCTTISVMGEDAKTSSTLIGYAKGSDTSTGGWVTTSVELKAGICDWLDDHVESDGAEDDGSPDAAQGYRVLDLRVVIRAGASHDYVAFDSFGIGTLEAPYDYMDGTSMATPCVAGGLAVLAAKYPEEGSDQIVARAKESVSVRESLTGRVATDGLLDLSAAIAAEPAVPGEPKTVDAIWPLYEIDLPLDTSTGVPFTGDAMGDCETYGQLVKCEGKLWYFPAMMSAGIYPEDELYEAYLKSYTCREARSFDIASGTWDEEPVALPYPLCDVSACSYDGKLWVMGSEAVIDENGEAFVDSDRAGTPHVMSYDPSTETWQECSASRIHNPEYMILYATDDGLRIFITRGYDPYGEDGAGYAKSSFWAYDPDSGRSAQKLGNLVDPEKGAISDASYNLTTHGSDVFVHRVSTNAIYRFDGTDTVKLNVTIPPALDRVGFLGSGQLQSRNSFQITTSSSTLVAGDEALYLVGYTDEDNSADTWIIPYGAADETEAVAAQPYGKRISSTRSLATAAVFADGKIYALATAWGEQDGRVFRSTEAEEQEEPDPTPAPDPDPSPSPTPDADSDGQEGPDPAPTPDSDPDPDAGQDPSSNPVPTPEAQPAVDNAETKTVPVAASPATASVSKIPSTGDQSLWLVTALIITACCSIVIAIYACRRIRSMS